MHSAASFLNFDIPDVLTLPSGTRYFLDPSAFSDGDLVEYLHELGVTIDRESMTELCRKFVTAKEIVGSFERKLPAGKLFRAEEVDVLWFCLTTLWARWLPEIPSVEALHSQIHAGYRLRPLKKCRMWLRAWKQFLELCDKLKISSVDEFDRRFRGSKPISEWIENLEDELKFSSYKFDQATDQEMVAIFYEAVLSRFPPSRLPDDSTERRRKALAKWYLACGQPEKAEAHLRVWLNNDPAWGRGWITWSDYYFFRHDEGSLRRSEELLREALSVPGVRNRLEVMVSLAATLADQGRGDESEKIMHTVDSLYKQEK